MQEFIAVNKGPKFLAREDAVKQTNEVCKALVNHDPVAAGAALLWGEWAAGLDDGADHGGLD